MHDPRILVGGLLLLCAPLHAGEALGPGDTGYVRAPLLGEPGAIARPEISDREPEDPAEWRPARMPPARPALRGGPSWELLGPHPTESAQVNVPPDDEVSGAIHAIAPHPTDADILYIGSVNGGIWKTTNATAARPVWVPQTESLPSQSIGAIEFDLTDLTRQTLIAGIGRWSNFARRGDDELGVYYTTNGGNSWSLLGGNTLLGQRMSGVAARGPILLAASISGSGGLFRSSNTGASWLRISGSNGLPNGPALDLAPDPAVLTRFYIAIDGTAPSVLRSDDSGATWTDITAGLSSLGSTTNNVRLSVGAGGVLFAAVVNSGRLAGVFRSPDQGANWDSMDVPDVHPGGQGTANTSLVAHPSDANLVYIGGDRIGSSPFTGNIVRGNFAAAAGSQFSLTMDAGGNGTSPHADSRDLAFDADGQLLESDDGGIYRRLTPTGSGNWTSVIGNLSLTEVHDLAHDAVSDIVIIGTQDNGTHIQQASGLPRWLFINGGDGGDVAVDDSSLGATASFRFYSSQNFGGPRRRQYTAANNSAGTTSLPGIADPQFVTPVELAYDDDSRLLVGGVNTLYESTNANAGSITLNSIGGPGANRNAMTYGAIGNNGVAYVGKNSAVHARSGGGAFQATAALPAGANTITDVVLDPNAPERVFAIDDNQVFFSSNGGSSWTDVTSNLPAVASVDFRTIEYLPGQVGPDRIALGTRSGVYVSNDDGQSWGLLGAGLPDVLVFDLRFNSGNQTLYAGTLGRGVWRLVLGQADALFEDGFE
ncbi:MAG: hypothetical protein R3F15_10265 [Lysobacterales bacterium]